MTMMPPSDRRPPSLNDIDQIKKVIVGLKEPFTANEVSNELDFKADNYALINKMISWDLVVNTKRTRNGLCLYVRKRR